jgi:hypothetical protein
MIVMSNATRTAVEADEVLVAQPVRAQQRAELRALRRVRQLAVHQHKGAVQEVRLLRQLFDGVPAVQQLALFAVDEGDLQRHVEAASLSGARRSETVGAAPRTCSSLWSRSRGHTCTRLRARV